MGHAHEVGHVEVHQGADKLLKGAAKAARTTDASPDGMSIPAGRDGEGQETQVCAGEAPICGWTGLLGSASPSTDFSAVFTRQQPSSLQPCDN